MDRSSSSYGQACTQCFKAKCRCVFTTTGGSTCERCDRLKKQCQPSRRRVLRHKEAEDRNRIAQLEQKVESLLTARKTASASEQLLFNPRTPNITLSQNQSTSLADLTHVSFSISTPSAGEADKHLSFFLQHILPCFPFMSFPENITASQLRHDRPVLFQAILTVSTFPTRQRQAHADLFKNLLLTSTLVKVQTNMDLLLGLLTYLTWTTDLFLGQADLVSRLMMLATSLVQDLRLLKPSQLDVQLGMTMTQGTAYEGSVPGSGDTFYDRLEKQRALLACYVLSLNISCHLGRQDSLRWTPQMEAGLNSLVHSKVVASDELFAFHVRTHVLMQEASRVRELHEAEIETQEPSAMRPSMPNLLYLKSLRPRLRDVVSQRPASDQDGAVFSIYTHYVELYINQLANAVSWGSPLFLEAKAEMTTQAASIDLERLDILWRSVENIKSWFESFFRIGPNDLIGMPAHFWSQMVMCLVILKYLSTLADPDWDRQAVRNAIDIISVIDRTLDTIEQTMKHPSLSSGDNLFSLLQKLLAKCRDWAVMSLGYSLDNAINAADGGSSSTRTQPHCSRSMPELGNMTAFQTMDLENDQWFEDLVGGSGLSL